MEFISLELDLGMGSNSVYRDTISFNARYRNYMYTS